MSTDLTSPPRGPPCDECRILWAESKQHKEQQPAIPVQGSNDIPSLWETNKHTDQAFNSTPGKDIVPALCDRWLEPLPFNNPFNQRFSKFAGWIPGEGLILKRCCC